MPKRKGSATARNATARKKRGDDAVSPQPLPDDDVFIPVIDHITTSADSVSDDDVFVPETPQYRPLATDGLSRHHYPLQVAGGGWRCRYGCPGVRNVAADLELHTWDCPYWEHEGHDETPF